jgi:hypothetical protein
MKTTTAPIRFASSQLDETRHLCAFFNALGIACRNVKCTLLLRGLDASDVDGGHLFPGALTPFPSERS